MPALEPQNIAPDDFNTQLIFKALTLAFRSNSTYPKVAVQWLNQTLCFYPSLCLVDSEVLRNRHLRVAAKRYRAF